MKTTIGVVSVAFYSEPFSRVLINSFRYCYPNIPLVIVDNNLDRVLGRKETERLIKRKDIVYIKNEGRSHHGLGLDLGVQYLRKKGINIVLTLDIDCIVVRCGFIELCQMLYSHGFVFGGRQGKRGGSYVHPIFGFYDLGFVYSNQSFHNQKGYDTGEEVTRAFEKVGCVPIYFDTQQYVEHFGCGSLLREDGVWAHKRFRDPDTGEMYRKKYLEKWDKFFHRSDVRKYLEKG